MVGDAERAVDLSSGCQNNVEARRSSFKEVASALGTATTCSGVVPTVAPGRTIALSSRRCQSQPTSSLPLGKSTGDAVIVSYS
jgi:hypothetical protein